MTKFTKTALITGGVLCVIGLFCTALSGIFNGWNWEFWKGEGSNMVQQENRTFSEKITNVALQVDNRAVVIEATDGSDVTVQYNYKPSDGMHLELSEGKLTLTEDKRVHFFNFGFTYDRTVYLKVPRDMAASMTVETANGKVSASGMQELAALSVETDNGKIELKDVSVKGDLRIKDSNATLELTNIRAGGLVYAKSSNGRLAWTDVTADQIEAVTSNGKIDLTRTQARATLSAKTSNGALTLERVAGQDISLRSSNGKISGTVLGRDVDYHIMSKTSNGSNNLPGDFNAGAQKTLSAETSNGGIDVRFVEE